MKKSVLIAISTFFISFSVIAGSANIELSKAGAGLTNHLQTSKAGNQGYFGYASSSSSYSFEYDASATSKGTGYLFGYDHPLDKDILSLGFLSFSEKTSTKISDSFASGGYTFALSVDGEMKQEVSSLFAQYLMNIKKDDFIVLMAQSLSIKDNHDYTALATNQALSYSETLALHGSTSHGLTDFTLGYTGALNDPYRFAVTFSPEVSSETDLSDDLSASKSRAGHGQMIIIGFGIQKETQSFGVDFISRNKSDKAGSDANAEMVFDGQYLISEDLVVEGMLSKADLKGSNDTQDSSQTQIRIAGYKTLKNLIIGLQLNQYNVSYDSTAENDDITSGSQSLLELSLTGAF
ncbi:MAG: hypothetical protein OEY59_12335 [Deltaproteobacteria bacterium]|nr:hypothetical protein [Deltaproteobacteria bacterium]